jgi:hypothetical protein
MSKFNVIVRTSGASNGKAWIVPQSLPLDVGVQLAPLGDLSDFATLVKADGSVVAAAPGAGTVLTVEAVNLRRYHRSEGEGKERVYSPTPSFALEFVVA